MTRHSSCSCLFTDHSRNLARSAWCHRDRGGSCSHSETTWASYTDNYQYVSVQADQWTTRPTMQIHYFYFWWRGNTESVRYLAKWTQVHIYWKQHTHKTRVQFENTLGTVWTFWLMTWNNRSSRYRNKGWWVDTQVFNVRDWGEDDCFAFLSLFKHFVSVWYIIFLTPVWQDWC